MALMSFDPMETLLRLQNNLDRAFGQTGFVPGASRVFPPLNVFSNRDGVVVRAEVPGIKPDGIDIEIEPRRLTISGERSPEEHKGGSYHRRERRFGKFARSIYLPDDLDVSRASADCKDGILTVSIPKAAAARPRTIQVQAA